MTVEPRAVLRSNARETFFISPHFEIQNGVATRYLFAGKLRIAMIQGNEMKFMHQDHLGSVVLITNGAGRPIERQAFQPFGQAGRDAGARFQDKEWEKTAQLYLHGARLYDPVLGIFISADSIVQDPFDPAAYERYLFARGNPLVFTDPSGHWFLVDDILIGAAIGALIGGSFSAITGGDILQGAIVGGISGAFFGAAGGLIEAAGGAAVPLAHQVGAHVVAGMFSGGIGAGAFGGNPGMGMLIGGVGAGAGKFATLSVPSAWGMPGKLAAASLSGGLVGGSVSAMGGGSFGHGFALGAAQATYGYFCNQLSHQWKDDYGNIVYGVNEGASSGSQKGVDASLQAAYALRTSQESLSTIKPPADSSTGPLLFYQAGAALIITGSEVFNYGVSMFIVGGPVGWVGGAIVGSTGLAITVSGVWTVYQGWKVDLGQ
jgi:RHS repeat-associated protein